MNKTVILSGTPSLDLGKGVYAAPHIQVVVMNFESAVLNGSNAGGYGYSSDTGDDECIGLD